ncbi:MAG: hypothetical protein HBSAPP03_01150 [Phycisphaerae bacterium]|nr:MAG: hypothetical protein HBSAPP03_01150 [Phycisphaerae bacterium]
MSQVPPLPPMPPSMPGPIRLPRYEPGAGTFSIGDAFSVGWATLKDNYGVLLGASILCMLVYFGGSIIGGLVPIVGSFVGIFLAPLWVSLTFVFVRAVRGHQVAASEFFPLLKVPYWSLVVIQLLVGVLGMVVALPMIIVIVILAIAGGAAGGGAASGALIAVAVLCVIVTMIAMMYIQARLGFSGLLFMDAPPGTLEIIESVKLSWKRTRDFAWPLVGLAILLALISLGTFVLLVVPLFLLGIPLALAATAAAYDMICPQAYSGTCPVCGYDCRNSPPGTCPECGAALPT